MSNGGFNPAGVVQSTGLTQGEAGTPVALTSTKTGTLAGPNASRAYGWAVVSNSSPWIMSVTGSDGTKTILPYSADLVIPARTVYYAMSAPPGPTITAQNPYVQADWYVIGGPPPPGSFPYSLTTAAITAAINAGASLLTTLHLNNGVSASITLPTQTGSLILLFNNPATFPGLGGMLISDGTITYFDSVNGVSQNINISPIWIDVASAVNSALTITWTQQLSDMVIYVLAASLPATAGIGPSAPSFVSQIEPSPKTPDSPFTATAASPASASILAAPTSGYVWEISHLSISATAAASATSQVSFRGVTSTKDYAGGGVLTGTAVNVQPTLARPILITEALNLVNSGVGVSVNGHAVARQIPLAQTLTST